jgi:hypothetical protein
MDGKSNYMEGLMLIVLYLILALACAFTVFPYLALHANNIHSLGFVNEND